MCTRRPAPRAMSAAFDGSNGKVAYVDRQNGLYIDDPWDEQPAQGPLATVGSSDIEDQVQAVYRVRTERICEECEMQLDDAHLPSEVLAQSPPKDLFYLLGNGRLLAHRRR